MFPLHAQVRPQDLKGQAEEVIREVDHRPHLLVRVMVEGGYFPHRALVPFVRLIEGEHVVVRAWFTQVVPNSTALAAYFPTDLPDDGILEFGYGPQAMGRVPVPFDAKSIKRLDRTRLSTEVVETTRAYVSKRQG